MKLIKLVVLGLSIVAVAQAATTGNLTLQGVVQEQLSLAVNAESVAANLDLEATQSDLLVATVDEASNSNTGYKVTLSSSNNGALKRVSGTETVAYTLKYDGGSVNLAGSSTTPVSAKSVGTAGVYSDSSNVQISYTGQADSSRVAGTYSDVITLEISAN